MNPKRAIGLLGLICLLSGGCAYSQELTRGLPGIKFMKYTMAGAEEALELLDVRSLGYPSTVETGSDPFKFLFVK